MHDCLSATSGANDAADCSLPFKAMYQVQVIRPFTDELHVLVVSE